MLFGGEIKTMENLKRQVTEVAILYYKENMTQQQIAEKLGLTRQTISKLLKIALDEGIVKITINDPEKQTQKLESELSERLGVKVVVGELTNGDITLRKIATVRTACDYLIKSIADGNNKIGIAWGKTVQEVIEELDKKKTCGNIIFPLVGATNRDVGCYYTNKMVEEFAKKTDATVHYAMFPNYVSKDDCDLIKRTKAYKDICELWGQMDIALVGIGNNKMVNDLRRNFDKTAIDDNFEGDIVTHIFDNDGNIINQSQDSLCVPFEDVKRAKNTIAVAYGNLKVEAIICACKTGAINTLITDEYTAREISEVI